MTPIQTLEVHNQSATGFKLQRDGRLIALATSDGFIKLIGEQSQRTYISESRHNLPVTCIGFMNTNNPMKPEVTNFATHLLTGSADYTYNFISVPPGTEGEGSSLVSTLASGLGSLIWHSFLLLVLLFFFSEYLV